MKYFESEKSLTEFMFLDPRLLYTFAALNQFCHENKIPLRITSLVRPLDTVSKSSTHQEGRAMDISTKDWTKQQIADVARFLVGWDALHEYGAISKKDKVRKICVYHNGHNHIQVKK